MKLLNRQPAWPSALLSAFAALLLFMTGCGGGGGGSANTIAPSPTVNPSNCSDSAGCSMAYIALTDADGDFLSYSVDVVSLKLKRANGTVVDTLPTQTRVDFAQYVDLTEFLTAASIPNGNYIEGTLTLDYTNAAITVEKSGQPVAATAVDGNGMTLGVVDVKVTLDNRSHLVVAPGRPALLTLDFNLAATNTVDLTTTPVKVTARPALIATLEPVQEKDLRVRGPLVSVDTAASSYVVDLRPFHHPTARHGKLTVVTNSATQFEVNGQSSMGAAGLQALQAAGAGTATIAFGTLKTSDRSFNAARVYAGSSVPGSNYDGLIGTIVARTGNELTVSGGTVIRNDSTATTMMDNRATYSLGLVKVLVGPDTIVLKDGMGVQTQGVQALSVGQSINVFGTASTATGGVTTIDATKGRVRMHLSHVIGTVVNTALPTLTLDVVAINGRKASAFNFAGTGTSSGTDADPTNYEVNTGSLVLPQVMMTGKPMRVFGYVTPFGTAPADFDARTLVTYTELRSQLDIGWGATGTSMPFASINNGGLTLDMTNTTIGTLHFLRTGPLVVDLKLLSSPPMIAPATSGAMVFAIAMPTGVRIYSDFAEFVTALNNTLVTNKMVNLDANGQYDQTTNVLTANMIVAVFR
jgi:hypothetical protein